MNGERQVLSKTFHALQKTITPLAVVLPYKYLQYHRAAKRKHVTHGCLCFSLPLTSFSYYLKIDTLQRRCGGGGSASVNGSEVEGNCCCCLDQPHGCYLLFHCLLLSVSIRWLALKTVGLTKKNPKESQMFLSVCVYVCVCGQLRMITWAQ